MTKNVGEMTKNVTMTIEHADPVTGEVSRVETTPEELQRLAEGFAASHEEQFAQDLHASLEQLRLGDKEDFPIPQDADPYVDDRYEAMRQKFSLAVHANVLADAEKKHATKIANIQKRRVAHLEVCMAEEMARCVSIDKEDVHVLAIDRNDSPEALKIDEWFLMSGHARVEAVVYSVWLNGMEVSYESMPQPEDSGETNE